MPLVTPSQMPGTHPINSPASSMSSSPVATTFGQQYGDVHSMTKMNAPSTGNADFHQGQEGSYYSYVQSSADVPYSCVGGSESTTTTAIGENDTQTQLS